jgi:hypothetical protein
VGSLGRLIIAVIPRFLALLGLVGTAAMLWVGGGIVIHGLEEFGLTGLAHFTHAHGLLGWLTGASISGAFGLLLGALIIVLAERVFEPVARSLRPG